MMDDLLLSAITQQAGAPPPKGEQNYAATKSRGSSDFTVEHTSCNSQVHIINVMMTRSRKVRSGSHSDWLPRCTTCLQDSPQTALRGAAHLVDCAVPQPWAGLGNHLWLSLHRTTEDAGW